MPTRTWVNSAFNAISADYRRSADTHLLKVDLPDKCRAKLYLKDESTHPTGSLKHRLARSLFLYGLANGWILEGTPIIEASSGSTAVSEAYFAKLLGLPFYAVMPESTSRSKIEQIEFYGGKCHFVTTGGDVYAEAQGLANRLGGHYMDQFTYAERATDWRGNNNVAESIFDQLRLESQPIPDWVVMSAGTGGTSATIGRYIRYQQLETRLCVADPENSVFFDCFRTGDRALTHDRPSNIEGIGRPRVEPSFISSAVDKMVKVPDAASIATIHFLEKLLNRKVGGSTGTNVYAALQLLSQMETTEKPITIVSMLCDSGDRYLDTYYNPDWLKEKKIDIEPYLGQLEYFYSTGRFKDDFSANVRFHGPK
jgi:cysteine synthase A